MDKVLASAAEIFSEETTIIDLIEKFATEKPNAEQVIFDGESFSRGWVYNKINQTSNSMVP